MEIFCRGRRRKILNRWLLIYLAPRNFFSWPRRSLLFSKPRFPALASFIKIKKVALPTGLLRKIRQDLHWDLSYPSNSVSTLSFTSIGWRLTPFSWRRLMSSVVYINSVFLLLELWRFKKALSWSSLSDRHLDLIYRTYQNKFFRKQAAAETKQPTNWKLLQWF